MKLALALCLALSPALAWGDVDPRFAKVRDAAKPVGGLAAFLEKYVGECSDAMAGAECKTNAAAFRKQATGKKFYLVVDEDSGGMMQMGPYDPSRGEFAIRITPFFGAGGYAVTQGAPRHTDARGNPVLPYIDVRAKVPEGESHSSMERLFSMRALRLQLVFTPQEVWSLPKKGGGKISGVKARIDAMLVTVGRTGDQLGVWTGR